jgi:germination protein YpeB
MCFANEEAITMFKKKWVRITLMSLAGALILGLSAYTIVLHDQNRNLKNQMGAVYQKSFDELMTDMNSLQTKLYKLEAATGLNQYSMLLTDVWRQTGDTEGAIAALPVSYAGTSTLTQFVNRTGDFCRSLLRKLSLGQSITEEEYEQVKDLAASCGDVTLSLKDLYAKGYPGDAGFAQDVFIPEEQTTGNLDFSNQDFPRLQYDGPFSESTENKQPEGLGRGEVTADAASAAAAKFLGVDTGALTSDGESNGRIPCWTFSGEMDGRGYVISVTKQGGQILWFRWDNGGGISAIPTDQRYRALTKAAQNYLVEKGYGESAASYAQFYNGMAVINLAPVEKNVVLYPDLVKVWVDISTSQVVGLDANNYLMSHKARELKAPVLDAAAAKEKITASLMVSSTRLALIPVETGEEKLCWEFTGKIDDRDYIIYVNTETGLEEDILMIQHTNDGELVM